MARGRYKFNSAGVQEFLTSEPMRAALDVRAERGLARAQAMAPVDSGAYKAGLKLVRDTTDRAVVRLVGTAPHTALVEAKTGNLVRALDAAR